LPSETTVNNSLPEIHASVSTTQPSLWRRLLAFSGPAYLISVGYMDPGNWATDLEGGAKFGYQLLWVLVLSNLMAILLQTLSARLGIVSRRDLAQACRETYPRSISWLLWMLCEIAIAACDLAEVLGAAIALNLLFHLPLLAGVLLTALDTLLILWFTRMGIRVIESLVLALVAVIAGCFFIEIWWAHPAVGEIARGILPTLNNRSLYVAIGILGATVMPHNLYLHSALVQTRRIGKSDAEKRTACRFNLIDSSIALNGALLVNAGILVLAASVFFRRGIEVTEIQQAHLLLAPLLGTSAAGVVFAIALLCSGQSSTLTGTLAGQIVMEGFLNFRMSPQLRRLLTRTAAILPAAFTVYLAGDRGTFELLILSQVVLSLQLPFAVVPLIHFTSDRKRMGAFANARWVQALSWTTAALIIVLNGWLIYNTLIDWLGKDFAYRPLVLAVVFALLGGVILLLSYVTFHPFLAKRALLSRRASRAFAPSLVEMPQAVAKRLPDVVYHSILVPLDHTALDRYAIRHAAALAKYPHAKLYLLHVEEGVTSQVYGPLASTEEVAAGQEYLEEIAAELAQQGFTVETEIRHSRNPRSEIIRYARELKPDLIVMGAHGHKGLKDIVFGTTINAVRHQLNVPLMIVRERE
jgi:manganese transport protein